MKVVIFVACIAAAFGSTCLNSDSCGGAEAVADFTKVAGCIIKSGGGTSPATTAHTIACSNGYGTPAGSATCTGGKWVKTGVPACPPVPNYCGVPVVNQKPDGKASEAAVATQYTKAATSVPSGAQLQVGGTVALPCQAGYEKTAATTTATCKAGTDSNAGSGIWGVAACVGYSVLTGADKVGAGSKCKTATPQAELTGDNQCKECNPGYKIKSDKSGCEAYAVLTDVGAGVKCKTATTTPNAEKDLQCAACNNGYELAATKLTCGLKAGYCATGNIAASTGYAKLDGAAAKKLDEWNDVDCAAGYKGTAGKGKLTCNANTEAAGTFGPSGCTLYTVPTTGAGNKCKTAKVAPAEKDNQCQECNDGYSLNADKVACDAIACDKAKWAEAAVTASYAWAQKDAAVVATRVCKDTAGKKAWADGPAVAAATTYDLAALKLKDYSTGGAITELTCASTHMGTPKAVCTSTTAAGSVTGCTQKGKCTKKATVTGDANNNDFTVPAGATDANPGDEVSYPCDKAGYYGKVSFTCNAGGSGAWAKTSNCLAVGGKKWTYDACPVNKCGVKASAPANKKCVEGKKSDDKMTQSWVDATGCTSEPGATFCKAGGADDKACKDAVAKCTKTTTGYPFPTGDKRDCGLDATTTEKALAAPTTAELAAETKVGDKITQTCADKYTGGVDYTCTEVYADAAKATIAWVATGKCVAVTTAPVTTAAAGAGESASSSISAFVALLSVIAYLA